MGLSKKTAVLLVLLFFLTLSHVGAAGPEIEAESAILINARTGEVLWEKDAYRRMHPASTTKILTTIMLMEHAEADDVARTSAKAAATSGSSLSLAAGQTLTVNDLLHGLMLHSANDASVVAAEHVAGSVNAFGVMMNLKAKQMGAQQSNFTNPHGLTEENHLTTAYDLAMIARYAMQNPRFRELAVTGQYTMNWRNGESKTVRNRNVMLSGYEGMLGIKSGYTHVARRTFVAAATRDGLELISVVLRCSVNGIWNDTTKLMDYGFAQYMAVRPFHKDEILGSAPVRFGKAVAVRAAEDFEITRESGYVDVAWELQLLRGIAAPVGEGDVLGQAVVYVDGTKVGSVPVVSAGPVSRAAVATGRFWFLSCLFVISGLRVRKVIRRKHRKILRRKRDSRYTARKFR